MCRQPHRDIANRSGGSGQYGNAINAFRAANVIVRGNRIRIAPFRRARNAASNIHIEGNAQHAGESRSIRVRIEARSSPTTASTAPPSGLVTNFMRRRLAWCRQHHPELEIPRPAGTDRATRPGSASRSKPIPSRQRDSALRDGIMLGWGRYLRDVAATAMWCARPISASRFGDTGRRHRAHRDNSSATASAAPSSAWGTKPVTGDLSQGGLSATPT